MAGRGREGLSLLSLGGTEAMSLSTPRASTWVEQLVWGSFASYSKDRISLSHLLLPQPFLGGSGRER